MTFRPRERRLALIAGVVIGSWLLVSWLVQPLWDRAKAFRLQVETQTEKLEALSRLAAQGPAVEREYQVLASYLDATDEEQAQSEFLDELEHLCRQSNLHLNLKRKPLKREGRMGRFEVELDVEGSQADLLEFLDALLHMPKLIAIDRLRLSNVPTKSDVLRANLVVQKLILR